MNRFAVNLYDGMGAVDEVLGENVGDVRAEEPVVVEKSKGEQQVPTFLALEAIPIKLMVFVTRGALRIHPIVWQVCPISARLRLVWVMDEVVHPMDVVWDDPS